MFLLNSQISSILAHGEAGAAASIPDSSTLTAVAVPSIEPATVAPTASVATVDVAMPIASTATGFDLFALD